MSEIKACKRCGSGKRVVGEEFLKTFYEIGCADCKYKVRAKTKERAVEMWNEEEKTQCEECGRETPESKICRKSDRVLCKWCCGCNGDKE